MDPQSLVRFMIEGKGYVSFTTLVEARGQQDACLIMEGDCGGSIYLTCPVPVIACNEETLVQLLADLDDAYWQDPDGAALCFEPRPIGSRVAGGTGGGRVSVGLWLHPDLEALDLRAETEAVLAGARARIDCKGRNVFD